MRSTLLLRLALLMGCWFATMLLGNSLQAQLLGRGTYQFTHKGDAFVYWGYNRAAFTTSDINFQGPGYGFTLYDVVARDRPSTGFRSYVDLVNLTTPQFNIRTGVFVTPRLAISLGYDHMKYVLQNDQIVQVTGAISTEASSRYAGQYNRTPTRLSKDFVRYEHTDGLNYFSIDVEYHLPIWSLSNGNLGLHAMGNVGTGIIVSRTEAYLLNRGSDTNYHISGMAGSAQVGLRVYVLKHFFLQPAFKIGYVNQTKVITDNSFNSWAQHDFGFRQIFIAFGGQWRMFGKTKAAPSK